MLTSKGVIWSALLILGGIILAQRFHTFNEPLERDIGVYAVVAHEMLAGRPLYSDLWEHRPPAIFLSYAAAEKLFGYGTPTIFLLSLILSLIILLGTYQAGRLAFGHWQWGLWAACFWALLSGDLFFQSNQPNTEIFINACLLWSYIALLPGEGKDLTWKRVVLTGALFAWASLYKPLAIISAIFLSAAYVLFPWSGRESFLRRLYSASVMGFVVLAAWFVTGVYYFFHGNLRDFYEANITFNAFFAGNAGQGLISYFSVPHHFFPVIFRNLWPFAVTACLAVFAGLRRRERPWILLVFWMLSLPIQIALQRFYHPHYYQYWMPVLVLAAAGALSLVAQKSKVLSYALALVLTGNLLWRERPFYRLAAEHWPHIKYGHQHFTADKELGLRLTQTLQDDETFFQWGYSPTLYFYSQKKPPTGLLHLRPAFEGPLREKLSSRMLNDLRQTKPALVIMSDWTFTGAPADHPVLRWVAQNYRAFPGNDLGHFVLFVLKGSRLEQRLSS